MQNRLYPPADRTTQWRGAGRPTMPAVEKLLLHTTESASWPSYPTFSPTLTFNPWKPRGQRWRQHCFINQAATTLANAGTYRTNRANVCQIEIVCYVDPKFKTSSAFYTHISADAYAELGEFYAWLNKEWDTPIRNGVRWKEYPASYGVHNGVRLSVQQFGTYEGLCGHMHAPEQTHGDPSLINVGLIIEKAKGDDDMPTAKEIANELAENEKFLTAVADAVASHDVVPNVWDADADVNKTVQIKNALANIGRQLKA